MARQIAVLENPQAGASFHLSRFGVKLVPYIIKLVQFFFTDLFLFKNDIHPIQCYQDAYGGATI